MRRGISLDDPRPYADDPVGFVTDRCREFLWSKQREICAAVVEHPRVAVKSCHSSGKSFVAARIVCWWIDAWPPGEAIVITSAPTFNQVRAILWREIGRAHSRGGLPGRMNQTEWFIGREMVAFGRKPEDSEPTAFQGYHAPHLLVVFDEACGVPESLWTAAETLAANEGCRLFAIGNPDDPQTEFGKICKPGSGWHVVTISAFDTPNLTGEEVPDAVRASLVSAAWVEDRCRRWGEMSPLYTSKVLGEFPEGSDDTLIAPRLVSAAVARDLQPDGPVELGVDVARFGRNETVIVARWGPRARMMRAARGWDTMRTTGEVVAAARETGAKVVRVDDVGVGGGVTDRLNEIKRDQPHGPLRDVEIVAINVGSSPSDGAEERFANLRAEVAWNLRDRFVAGDIDVEADDDLQAQLCAVRYSLNSRGRIVVESKDDMEKRLVGLESSSPDRFDALALAFAKVEDARRGVEVGSDVLDMFRAEAALRRYRRR